VHSGPMRGQLPGMVASSGAESAQASPARVQFPCGAHFVVFVETP
jgi:hypothetical protein